MQNEHKHIGYLIQQSTQTVVICTSCHQKDKNSPQKFPQGSKLFEENIKPYKQNCHCCNQVMVLGQTDSWSELYPPHSEQPAIAV